MFVPPVHYPPTPILRPQSLSAIPSTKGKNKKSGRFDIAHIAKGAKDDVKAPASFGKVEEQSVKAGGQRVDVAQRGVLWIKELRK